MTTPRHRILVCDDEPDIRTVVGLNLGLVGMDFGEASGGEDAIRQLDAGGWDALVLDLMMPHVDGFHVLEHLQAEDKGKLAVVVLSAQNSPQAALRALRLGAHAHLTKPFSPVAVAQLLEELIEMSEAERETRRLDAMERASTFDRMGMPTI